MEILNRKTLNHPHDSLSRTAMILRGSRALLSSPSSHHRSCEWCGPFVVCRHSNFPSLVSVCVQWCLPRHC